MSNQVAVVHGKLSIAITFFAFQTKLSFLECSFYAEKKKKKKHARNLTRVYISRFYSNNNERRKVHRNNLFRCSFLTGMNFVLKLNRIETKMHDDSIDSI